MKIIAEKRKKNNIQCAWTRKAWFMWARKRGAKTKGVLGSAQVADSSSGKKRSHKSVKFNAKELEV